MKCHRQKRWRDEGREKKRYTLQRGSKKLKALDLSGSEVVKFNSCFIDLLKLRTSTSYMSFFFLQGLPPDVYFKLQRRSHFVFFFLFLLFPPFTVSLPSVAPSPPSPFFWFRVLLPLGDQFSKETTDLPTCCPDPALQSKVLFHSEGSWWWRWSYPFFFLILGQLSHRLHHSF